MRLLALFACLFVGLSAQAAPKKEAKRDIFAEIGGGEEAPVLSYICATKADCPSLHECVLRTKAWASTSSTTASVFQLPGGSQELTPVAEL